MYTNVSYLMGIISYLGRIEEKIQATDKVLGKLLIPMHQRKGNFLFALKR